MEKIKKYQDKPSWYRPENYDALLNLTLQELIFQLESRMLLYYLSGDECDGMGFSQILRGDPILVSKSYSDAGGAHKKIATPFSDQKPRLKCGEHVYPVTFREIHSAGLMAEKNGAFIDGKLSAEYSEASFSYMDIEDIRDRGTEDVGWLPLMLILDLRAIDEELIQDISELLPGYRKDLNVEIEPLDSGRIGNMTLGKLIVQRTIPLIDMLIWQKNMEVEITYEALSRIIFDSYHATTYPNGLDMKRVYIPAAKRALSDDFYRSLCLFLKHNPELINRKVSDHLEINNCIYP
ncbi:DUF6387 family protein [Amphritea sp. HPY]|uniref:DUF6387 family protein n=1 Tax=Amphritea sp. HPY TaxID=3421652 RepID=UPI003D7C78D6